MAKHWTPEEDSLLREIYPVNNKKCVQEKFSDKPWTTILRRALKLKLHRLPELINEDRLDRATRKDIWTEEEEKLLKKIYGGSFKVDILKKINRPWKGIIYRANNLGLVRNKDIVLQENIESNIKTSAEHSIWTLELIEELKRLYTTSSKKEILEKLNLKWTTIRNKAYSLGIERNKELIVADIVASNKESMLKNHKVKYSTQLESMKEKSRATNMEKRGVPYPSQNKKVRDLIRITVQERYGTDNVFQSKEIKEKIIKTNIERYGVASPLQNKEILQKVQETTKNNNSFSLSDEEIAFYEYLKEIDPYAEHQVTHPTSKFIIDYYSPKFNLWIQYDGDYWHGRIPFTKSTPRTEHIIETMERDKIQNENIPNLIRFWDSDVKKAIKDDFIKELINKKIIEKAKISFECHQYKKKIEFFNEDIAQIKIDPSSINASNFTLKPEPLSQDIVNFIKKYEWLGNIGVTPKWCFTARLNNLLGGVVLVNEPTSYSKLLGAGTPKYEALIQRGATASWTPKNLGSRLVMFSCRWMIKNTIKRIFVGYADPKAHEIGTIYQACNFEYIGDNFGSSYLYRNNAIKNGNTFSAQTLKRTSSFRRWCKDNNIIVEKSWIKENHFKNLSNIPIEIKNKWYSWIKDTLNNSEKFPTEKKHKYALLLWNNNKEKKELILIKNYKALPYPKRGKHNISDLKSVFEGEDKPLTLSYSTSRLNTSTKSRVTQEKITCIIDNFSSKSIKEIACILNETIRWVQSQIKKLIKEGIVTPKNPIGATKSRITDEKLSFIKNNHGIKTSTQIALELGETKRWVKRQLLFIKTNHP